MAEPRVRASQPQELLQHLGKHEPATLARLRATAPPSALRTVEDAARTDWIPVDTYDAIAEAVVALVGEVKYRALLKDYTVGVVDGPLFGAIMGTTRRLFGMSPGAVIRMFPTGFNLAYRDFGSCAAVSSAEEKVAAVEFKAVHARNLCPSFIAGNLGAMDAFVHLGRASADVTADRSRVAQGTLVLSVRWK